MFFSQLYGFVCFGTQPWHLPFVLFSVVLINGTVWYCPAYLSHSKCDNIYTLRLLLRSYIKTYSCIYHLFVIQKSMTGLLSASEKKNFSHVILWNESMVNNSNLVKQYGRAQFKDTNVKFKVWTFAYF